MKKLQVLILAFFILWVGNTSCTQPTDIFIKDNSEKTTNQNQADGNVVYFKKVTEPKEGAFELLVPKGWNYQGGIYRVDPQTQGGAAQSIAAKNDFAVFNNQSKDVMIRWLPDNFFFDMTGAPAAPFFPQGSNYNGMLVMPKCNAVTFVQNVVFPYAHPRASNVNYKNSKNLSGLAKAYKDYSLKLSLMLTMGYYATMVTVEYIENGKQYEEYIVAVVEDYGSLGAGLWSNKNTLFIRAPKGELQKWASLLQTIHASVKLNTKWLMAEARGQQTRANTLIQVQHEVQNIDREIAAHTQKINYEINNDMYLTLTDQEEYINPYSGEVEIGTNQWQNRWQNDLGEIIYTNNDSYNPNFDPELNVSGFKRSKIRKR